MKKSHSLAAASLLLLLTATGCQQSNQNSDVVKETYIHNYGVPVAKTSWDEQGQDGKVIKLKKNGVTLTQSFSNGVLDGESTYTFPNSSTTHRIELFENGVLVTKQENYPSGVPMRQEIYEDDVLVQSTRWYEDGLPAATEAYQGEYLVQCEYHSPSNAVEAQVRNGHGTRICRTREGDLLSKDSIENGEMVERITYFANGDPATITPYIGGNAHGTRLTYLQGGLPNTTEQWIQGKQTGVTIVYLNAQKYAEVPYINGKKCGVELRYRDGSVLVEELSWKDNTQHGLHKIHVDGDIKAEWFNQGELVSRAVYERMNIPR